MQHCKLGAWVQCAPKGSTDQCWWPGARHLTRVNGSPDCLIFESVASRSYVAGMTDDAAAAQTLAYEFARETLLTRRARVSAQLCRARAAGDMVSLQNLQAEQLGIAGELRALSVFDFGDAVQP